MIGQVIDKLTQIKSSESPEIMVNPFPGLRPFSFEESYLFYGQDRICNQVIQKLISNKFVCILGGAGVGKTSLINCGIQPLVLSGLLDGPETNWHCFRTQPGLNPIRNLAKVIYNSKFKDSFNENQRIHEQICRSILHRGRYGLVELISQFQLAGDHKYLFIIDQFEDLFKLRYNTNEIEFYEEALQYVNLFIEALSSTKYQVHVVISIRSDFTDDCVIFPALADFINKSNVLIPKMSREQVREIVINPLRAMGIKIEDSVMVQILNDSATIDDMLPRLQHALHRTWESWMSLNNLEKPITTKEYETVGGIKYSVSNHANSLYDELNENDKKLCEIIFKSLTERGSENKGLSRPVSIAEIAEIAKVETSDIIRVATVFCQFRSDFLVSDEEQLSATSVLDLSHVSLMRAWNRLKEWVEDEAISSQMYRQLSQASAAYQVGRAGLLKPPDLQFAVNWKEKQKPTLQWAKRYNPAFERTIVYLKTSHEKYEAEEAFKRKKAKQAIRKVRSFSIVLGSTAILAIALTVYSQILKQNAERLKRIAIEQKYEADAKSEKAEQISKEALEEKGKAELAANEAERLRQQVLEQSKSLEVQKNIAEITAEQALRKSSETEQNLVQVSKQKDQIEQSVLQANIQKTQAEKEKEEAFKKRMLTIAQTIASRSLQIQGNKNLKSALAVLAYEFNLSNGGADSNADIYNAVSSALNEQGQNVRHAFKGHTASVKSVVVSPKSNTLYSTGSDGKVLAWNLNDAIPTPKTILKNLQGNLCLAISPNGRMLAVGSDNGVIQIIDLNYPDIAPVQKKAHQGTVYALAFSKDGQQLYSSGSDKSILLWDISLTSSNQIFKETASTRVLSLSPDGRFLAGGSDDGRLLLWETKTNQLTVLSSEDTNPIYSLAFNNGGTVLASGDVKGGVKLWNPYSHKVIYSFKNHMARVVALTFSPSGDFMASSSYDGSVFIFDTKNIASPPILIKEPSTWILSIAFSSDSKRLVLATNKADFLLAYPTQSKYMVNQLCGKISKALTQEEWNTYIGSDIKYRKPCE
jgi:WD40 repeat protein